MAQLDMPKNAKKAVKAGIAKNGMKAGQKVGKTARKGCK
jgi:hypothetical protein